MKSNNNAGFSLIEVLLAMGILAGTILCLLAVFTPALVRTKNIEILRATSDIERKMNAFIQSRPFEEIFVYARENQSFYFYKDTDEVQKFTKDLESINPSSIIKVSLSIADGLNIATLRPEDYPKSYLPIWVEIYLIKNITEANNKQKSLVSFTRIKNR